MIVATLLMASLLSMAKLNEFSWMQIEVPHIHWYLFHVYKCIKILSSGSEVNICLFKKEKLTCFETLLSILVIFTNCKTSFCMPAHNGKNFVYNYLMHTRLKNLLSAKTT